MKVSTWSTSWSIQVSGAKIQSHTFYLQDKDICFLSAHTKLAASGMMVRLSSKELAQEFIDAVFDVFKRRHGDGLQLTVLQVNGSDRRKDFDDAVVLARISEMNFAPNKAPVVTEKILKQVTPAPIDAQSQKHDPIDPFYSLDRSSAKIYLLWKTGYDLKTNFSKSTLYKHRKIILLIGIDIFTSPKKSAIEKIESITQKTTPPGK